MDMMPELGPVAYSSIAIYFFQKYMKSRPIYAQVVRAIPMADKWLHRGFAGIASLLFAFGIDYTIMGTIETGYKITLGIPDIWTVFHHMLDWSGIFGGQQILYELAKQPMWRPGDNEPQIQAPPKV